MREALRHHVKLVERAVQNGRSAEEEAKRLLTTYRWHYGQTWSGEEIDPQAKARFTKGMRKLFAVVRSGDFINVDDRKIENASVADVLCKSCPPNSKGGSRCKRNPAVLKK